MDEWWWYLTRASGIVATILAVGSLVFGAFFSARNTGSRRTPAWWLDLHNYLGGLALIFTGVHLLASVLDPNSGIGIVQVLDPGDSRNGHLGRHMGSAGDVHVRDRCVHVVAAQAVHAKGLALAASHVGRRGCPRRHPRFPARIRCDRRDCSKVGS